MYRETHDRENVRPHSIIPTALPSHDRERIQRALLDMHFEGLPRSSIGNFLVALLSTFPLIPRFSTSSIIMLFALVAAGAVGLLWFWHQWGRNSKSSTAKRMTAAMLASASMSLCWAIIVQYYFMNGGDVVRGLVSMMAAGLMAAAVIACSTVPRTGIIFISILGGSVLIAQARANTVEFWVSFALTSVFIMILLSSLIEKYNMELAQLLKEKELTNTAETVKLLLNDYEQQSSDWLWKTDESGRVIAPSQRFQESSAGAVRAGMHFDTLFDERPEADMLRAALIEGKPFRNLVLQLRQGNAVRWWSLSGRPRHTDMMKFEGMEGVASDVTEARQAAARINYMAHHDALTGLPNRFLLNEKLEAVLTAPEMPKELSLLYLDLDNFKMINDSLGHSVGDKVLQRVAQLLQEQMHAGDTVARLGGDEFAILLDPASPGDRARAVAAEIIALLNAPFRIDEHQIFTGTSVGIAKAPRDAQTPGDLLRNADLALYHAKANGRGLVTIFRPEMYKVMLERQSLEHDLHLAIAKDELELHYQPLIEVASGQIVGYEALLRWDHPSRGMVMPDQFIPLAEENGQILQLGEWVLRKALGEVAHWPSHLKVAINISPMQLRSSSFAANVQNALAATGVQACRLELEVTETVLLDASSNVLAMLHSLRNSGIRVALDDFGTGYASLHYLRSFPFDKIKIDRSFVGNLESDSDCLAIVRAVVSLARSFGMETTAEGVETPEQLQQLSAEGVTEAQGYLYSRARLAEHFENLRPPRPEQKIGV